MKTVYANGQLIGRHIAFGRYCPTVRVSSWRRDIPESAVVLAAILHA
jgi:hypothetical protein